MTSANLYNLLDQRKVIYSVQERFRAYKQGQRDFAPWSIEVHPTSNCNLSCGHCSYLYRNQNHASLTPEILKRLIQSIIVLGVRGAYFSGGGEPLLTPGISEYILSLVNAKIEVAVLTNGSILNNREDLINAVSRLNYLAVSVPSVNSQTYISITGRDSLDAVLNIPSLLKRHHPSPIIGSRIVISDKNYKEVFDILECVQQKGFDYALFKIAKDYESRNLGLSQEGAGFLKAEIALRSEKINEDFTNLKSIFNEHGQGVHHQSARCWTVDFRLLCNIHTNGEVYLCLPLIGKPEYCIGDLNKATLQDMWNSQRHREVIESLQQRFRQGLCRYCRAIAYNKYIQSFLNMFPETEDAFL